MIQNSFSSLLLKIFLLFLVLIYFSAISSAQAQCLPPEATVLSGSCDSCFMAVVQVSDPNDPVNGVLNLEFTSFRGDGGSGGIPVTGIPSVVTGTTTLNIGVGNVNNFGTVQITITNSCCETTGVSLTNFSRSNKNNSIISKGTIHNSVKYIGNSCNVSGIQSVLLEKLDGTALEVNPTPLGNEITVNGIKYGGGVRFFPDAISPLGKPQKLIVKAKLANPQANIPIYFRSFDVDDSSGLFNNATNTGQDNQGPVVRSDGIPTEGKFDGFANGATASAITDTDGVASAVFIVTMQPGDNFKIVATTNQTLVDNTPPALIVSGQQIINLTNNQHPLPQQPDTGQLATPSEAVTSQLITVWRYLHVEVDSMLAPLSPNVLAASPMQINYIKGNIEEIIIIPTQSNLFLQTFFTDQVLRDASFDLQKTPLGAGRFENGNLTIGQSFSTTVGGNGEKQAVTGPFVQQQIPQIPCQLINTNGNTIASSIIQMRKGNISRTSNIPNSFSLSSIPRGAAQYNGGRIVVGGISFTIGQINGNTVELDTTVQQPPFNLPFIIFDDDQIVAPSLSYPQDFQLMQTSDLAQENLFATTYIKPIFDLPSSTTPFRANINDGEELTSQISSGKDNFSTNNFWVVYVQAGWQAATPNDMDPDELSRGITLGQTPAASLVSLLGSVISLETTRDTAATFGQILPHITQNLLNKITTVHECGHQLGAPDRPLGTNGGIMEEIPLRDSRYMHLSTFAFFVDRDQKTIRTRMRPMR